MPRCNPYSFLKQGYIRAHTTSKALALLKSAMNRGMYPGSGDKTMCITFCAVRKMQQPAKGMVGRPGHAMPDYMPKNAKIARPPEQARPYPVYFV